MPTNSKIAILRKTQLKALENRRFGESFSPQNLIEIMSIFIKRRAKWPTLGNLADLEIFKIFLQEKII